MKTNWIKWFFHTQQQQKTYLILDSSAKVGKELLESICGINEAVSCDSYNE